MRPIGRILARPTPAPDTAKSLLINGEYDGRMWIPFSTQATSREEKIEHSFESYVSRAYKSNGIVFACSVARMLPFSEARVTYQELNDGRPGKLFGGPGLRLLENPWANTTTGGLFSRMMQDGDLAGNFYGAKVAAGTADERMFRMRADWTTIVSGVVGDPDAAPGELETELLGYFYHPPKGKKTFLTPDRVVHFAPIPDPDAAWRGMSWLTPIMQEIDADTRTTAHKARFFRNGATPSFVVRYDPTITPENLKAFIAMFKQEHTGTDNAFKVLHLGGGADATTVGSSMKDMDFKATQGAGETRIAAAAGVGAIMARLSEGMQGSALNQGNYGAAKRQFADMTLRPLWREAVGSLAKFGNVPAGARLWTDTRDVAFLAEDAKDEAAILTANAATVRTLIEAGYKPDAVTAAVIAGDLSLLTGQHTGRQSVQLVAASDTLPEGGNP